MPKVNYDKPINGEIGKGSCFIVGTLYDLQADVFTELIMTGLSLARKAHRALINGDRFNASEYTRMKRMETL